MELSFGSRLKNLRKIRGLTQEQLAESCQVSTSCVSRWENDKLQPNSGNVLALSRALHVDIAELFPVTLEELPKSLIIREVVTILEQLTHAEQVFFLDTIKRYKQMQDSSNSSLIIS